MTLTFGNVKLLDISFENLQLRLEQIMNFSSEQMTDMIYVFGTGDKNTLLATRLYHERFREGKVPTRKSFEL